MKDKEFNLLDENWVRVILPDCSVKEVPLTDAIVHAHEYGDLCGELPTQNVAVMRLLLAVLHTVFSRADEEGNPAPLEEAEDALLRWKAIWDMGHFPEKPVRDYLEAQHEKFWLFHPERPFYQVPEAKIGTEYFAPKLNGEILESNNKARLFNSYSGKEKNELGYAEAARWLLYLNAYDDAGVKKKEKEANSTSIRKGWLSDLGVITAKGKNLFETLMLNFIMLKDENGLWGEEKPSWELEKARSAECSEIAMPDNLSELYTMQSRRIILVRENDVVTGYHALCGDSFNKEMAFSEQMTIWGPMYAKTKDKSVIGFRPCRHDSTKQMWREFPTIFPAGNGENVRTPGVVSWITELQYEGLLDDEQMIKFGICSIEYGTMESSVLDMFSDSLSFHGKLLEKAEEGWRSAIADEISKCEELAMAIYNLAKKLDKATGYSDKSKDSKNKEKFYTDAKEQLYFRIDILFRTWLESIDSKWGTDEADADRIRWRKIAEKIAIVLGEEMVNDAGESAFIGKIIKKEDKNTRKSTTKTTQKSDKTQIFSSAKALMDFINNVKRIYS